MVSEPLKEAVGIFMAPLLPSLAIAVLLNILGEGKGEGEREGWVEGGRCEHKMGGEGRGWKG